ncbi:putative membrane protein [hydrothermal vent metagenome]|uniref:Putative membrane protein n=1 Tax=hydrothermal vent metagenome TaxID=652676 RepID=A0A3B0S7U5_9ZZZZ
MPTGLVALLDDVAAIAKVAAASIDDIGAAAARAGTKSAGVVIDDAAVTPAYVTGFDPSRELPMIWKIAKGSIKNKLLFLLPAAVLLGQFAPFLIPAILIIGGLFLCYEAAEKVLELFHIDETNKHDEPAIIQGQGREEEMVSGAIRTDFILSAEIMAIALSEVTDEVWWQQGIILAVIGVVITVAVYGAVALIVKMDDVGLHLATKNEGFVASFGRGLVSLMPKLLAGLSIIGTLAMAWVGGGLLVHNIAALGWHGPEYLIDWMAHPIVAAVPSRLSVFLGGIIFAVLSGILGVVIGAIIVPLVRKFFPHGEAH